MSSKEKGMIQELTDFIKASRRFIVNCEKPDGKRKTTFTYLINSYIYNSKKSQRTVQSAFSLWVQ